MSRAAAHISVSCLAILCRAPFTVQSLSTCEREHIETGHFLWNSRCIHQSFLFSPFPVFLYCQLFTARMSSFSTSFSSTLPHTHIATHSTHLFAHLIANFYTDWLLNVRFMSLHHQHHPQFTQLRLATNVASLVSFAVPSHIDDSHLFLSLHLWCGQTTNFVFRNISALDVYMRLFHCDGNWVNFDVWIWYNCEIHTGHIQSLCIVIKVQVEHVGECHLKSSFELV